MDRRMAPLVCPESEDAGSAHCYPVSEVGSREFHELLNLVIGLFLVARPT